MTTLKILKDIDNSSNLQNEPSYKGIIISNIKTVIAKLLYPYLYGNSNKTTLIDTEILLIDTEIFKKLSEKIGRDEVLNNLTCILIELGDLNPQIDKNGVLNEDFLSYINKVKELENYGFSEDFLISCFDYYKIFKNHLTYMLVELGDLNPQIDKNGELNEDYITYIRKVKEAKKYGFSEKLLISCFHYYKIFRNKLKNHLDVSRGVIDAELDTL